MIFLLLDFYLKKFNALNFLNGNDTGNSEKEMDIGSYVQNTITPSSMFMTFAAI